jgi:hypothetical protein
MYINFRLRVYVLCIYVQCTVMYNIYQIEVTEEEFLCTIKYLHLNNFLFN